jgi:threonine/homoserine/homoserine lactone efflux protein
VGNPTLAHVRHRFQQRTFCLDFNIWLSFAAASALVLILPGPTLLALLSQVLTKGPRVGWAGVAGIVCGDFIVASLVLTGLGPLLAVSGLVFSLLKWLGAFCLIWLGLE